MNKPKQKESQELILGSLTSVRKHADSGGDRERLGRSPCLPRDLCSRVPLPTHIATLVLNLKENLRFTKFTQCT